MVFRGMISCQAVGRRSAGQQVKNKPSQRNYSCQQRRSYVSRQQ